MKILWSALLHRATIMMTLDCHKVFHILMVVVINAQSLHTGQFASGTFRQMDNDTDCSDGRVLISLP